MIKNLIFIATMAFAGCSASLQLPTENDARLFRSMDSTITIDILRSDRQLYITKCSGCHSLYLPTDFTVTEWKTILPAMEVRSKITAHETDRINRYLKLYALQSR